MWSGARQGRPTPLFRVAELVYSEWRTRCPVCEGVIMAATSRFPLLSWTTITPVLGVLLLVLAWGRDLAPVLVALVAVVLAATVLAAVHHAEVVALRVGEPFGSLVLAVAVTIIEVALIVTLMVSGGP